MTLLDWGIVVVCVLGLSAFSIWTIRLTKGVADFLAANRTGGRYMISIANGMAGIGAISMVAMWEVYYSSGLSSVWWQMMSIWVLPFITMTGWCYYRFRETRALTLSQFFEERYGKRFRIFAGFVAYLSGILNFGIFPAVAARFFVYFCGFPTSVNVYGLDVPTFAIVMFLTLGAALLFTMGGHVTVMLTDCVQGIFVGLAFVLVALVVYYQFGWPHIVEGLARAPEGASMVHPFRSMNVKDFNVFFWLIGVFGGFYGSLAWQGSQAYNACAINPHEQKMGQIILVWRLIPQGLLLVLLGICAYAFLNHPDFASQAAPVTKYLSSLPNQYIADQMRVPVAMGHFLPIGIKGVLFAVVLFALVTTQDTYLHSWGSIFIQDVYMPMRKSRKLLDPNLHIRLLRWSIIGVAVFSYIFSLLYPPTEAILMWFAITGTVYIGGAGAIIVGGLYWRRATTPAAYTALITGMAMGLFGMVIPKIYPAWPINNQYMFFLSVCTAVMLFVVISLITSRAREPFNLEKMLHRGQYAIEGEHVKPKDALRARWQTFVGITEEFSSRDKVLAVALVAWNGFWMAVFLGVTAWNLVADVSTDWWNKFWHYWIWMQILVSVPATIWFTIGATLDIRRVIKLLSTRERDVCDDGVVREESEIEAIPECAPVPAESAEDTR